MLNKDLLVRRGDNGGANQENGVLEGASFFPRRDQKPVPPPFPEGQGTNGPKAATANAKKWDDLLPQIGSDVWVRKKEPIPPPQAEKSGSKKPMTVLEPAKLPGTPKPPTEVKPPAQPAKARADLKTLDAAGVPEIIFQRKGGAAAPKPEPKVEAPPVIVEEPVPVPVQLFAPEPAAPMEEEINQEVTPIAQFPEFQESQPVESSEPPLDVIEAQARLTAEYEKEKAERRRIEQRATSLAGQLQALHQELSTQLEAEQHNQKRIVELEEESKTDKAELTRLRTEAENYGVEREKAAAQAKTIGELRERLQKALSLFEKGHEALQGSRKELEASFGTLSLAESNKTGCSSATAESDAEQAR